MTGELTGLATCSSSLGAASDPHNDAPESAEGCDERCRRPHPVCWRDGRRRLALRGRGDARLLLYAR